MDKASQVPPPVYHPKLVADAVLHAAVHPTRDITVGGAGGMMIWLTRLMPSLADQLYSRLYFYTALSKDPPRGGDSALYKAGGEGEMLGDQEGYVREYSCYTAAQKSPWLKPALITTSALLATFALSRCFGRHRS